MELVYESFYKGHHYDTQNWCRKISTDPDPQNACGVFFNLR